MVLLPFLVGYLPQNYRLILIMKLFQTILFISFFLQLTSAFAQTFERFDVPVNVNGMELKNPWVGGLNAPQYSTGDFNDDGLLDLFVFDRIGNIPMVFLNEGVSGEISYKFAPEYLEGIPALDSWALLRDYDQDGIVDIFSYPTSPSGIQVHKGFLKDGKLQFEKVKFPNYSFDVLSFTNLSGLDINLYVSSIDIPAIDDLDNDGDLDVLTFASSGGKVEYYRNVSVERGFGTDSLIYVLDDNCWGGIYESGDQPALDLSSRAGDCARRLTGVVEPRHTGSTLLTFDMDNDCDKELLLGDLSFDQMVLAINGGDCDDAWVNKQDIFFPSENVPIGIPSFPAAFHLDVNNDGKRDLIAAKNVTNGGEDINTSWLYLNIGSEEMPEFSIQQTNFLTNQMLDFGTGSNPAFVDYNADGLIDLVVGSEGEFDRLAGANSTSKLALFENVGTITNPIYELIDDNWMDLERFSKVGGGNDFGFSPSFGDLNNDGFDDLLVGSLDGGFFYFENKGISTTMDFNSPVIKFQDLDVGRFSSIEVRDIDSDGLKDLIIGEQNAGLNFYKNIGTPDNPTFEPDEDIAPNSSFFGKIDLRENGFQTGFGTPVFVSDGNNEFLVTGNEYGSIRRYGLENDFSTAWPLLDGNIGETINGARTVPDFADVDGDGFFEMVVGNYRGGLTFYKTNFVNSTVGTDDIAKKSQVLIIPNPSNEAFQIQSEIKGIWKLFDVSGKVLNSGTHDGFSTKISTSEFAEGIYFVNIISKHGRSFSKKVLIQH